MFTNIDEALKEISLLQISDSFFPTGLYSTSNGLESIFLQKKVSTGDEVAHLITIQIEQQIGPFDCVALTNTIKSANSEDIGSILEIDELVHASKGVKALRESSARSGVQLIKAIRQSMPKSQMLERYYEMIESGDAIGTYPVCFGVCCSALGIDIAKSLLSFLYGFSLSIVGAALRLGIIQHFEGQKIIQIIKPTIADTAIKNAEKPLSEIWQFAPQMEIYQMQHERIDSRMFIT